MREGEGSVCDILSIFESHHLNFSLSRVSELINESELPTDLPQSHCRDRERWARSAIGQ